MCFRRRRVDVGASMACGSRSGGATGFFENSPECGRLSDVQFAGMDDDDGTAHSKIKMRLLQLMRTKNAHVAL
jgi:hypothetical protein